MLLAQGRLYSTMLVWISYNSVGKTCGNLYEENLDGETKSMTRIWRSWRLLEFLWARTATFLRLECWLHTSQISLWKSIDSCVKPGLSETEQEWVFLIEDAHVKCMA